jgi:hypothetical protein
MNKEGKFSLSKAVIGKYEVIEKKDMDDRLKELCYKMIKMVCVYMCVYS